MLSSDSVSSALAQAGQLQSTVSSTEQAIAQGNSVFDAASSAGDGSYAGLASLAQGIVSDLPPGKVTTALSVVVHVGEGALSGFATATAVGTLAGSAIFPPLGTAAGAAIGAIVGAGIAIADDWNQIEGLFSSSDPTQTDYRYLSDRVCFPSAPNGVPYGVVPGAMRWNPRCNPQSSFYQTPQGPNMAPTRPFTFDVLWRPIPGSTRKSRSDAWALAQLYTQTLARRMGHKFAAGTITHDQVQAQLGPDLFKRAMRNMDAWYGHPGMFNATIPFSASGGNPPNISNDLQNVLATAKEFERFPLDFLYYPVLSDYDHGVKLFKPSAEKSLTDVMMTADTSALTVAEFAVQDRHPAEVFHWFLLLSHYWHVARQRDAKKYPGISVANHPNFSRVLGLTSALIVKEARAVKAAQRLPKVHPAVAQIASTVVATSSITAPVTAKGFQASGINPDGAATPMDGSGGKILIGAAVGIGALWLLTRGQK